MIKKIVTFLLLFSAFQSFSQKLVYKSNGTILNSQNQKMKSDQVRELLANNENLLADYNAGRSKKTVGNVLLYGGSALVLSDMLTNLFSKQKLTYSNDIAHDIIRVENRIYPSVFTYIGAVAIVSAIPIKIGFSKKIKNVVTEYNNKPNIGYNQTNNQELNFITNSNGIGLRLTLN